MFLPLPICPSGYITVILLRDIVQGIFCVLCVRLARDTSLFDFCSLLYFYMHRGSTGRFIVDPEMRLEIVAPDLAGFKVNFVSY